MTNENRSDQPWKKLLEDEVALSGELIQDKTAVWQALHHRLHLQYRRKKLAVYWAVAASLLLMITMPFVFLQDNKHSVVKHIASKKDKPALSGQPPAPKRATAIIEMAHVAHSTKKEAIKNRIKDSNPSPAVNVDSGLVINKAEENGEISSLPPLVVDSSSAPAVAAVPPKKQWKVVHVNELGDPVAASPTWTHSKEQHSFELQIGKEEVVANTAVSIDKPAFTLIKIKTSPTN